MSIRDVAELANVSVTTASRALNGTGRVSEQTRQRVRDAAHEIGYQPNELARQLKGGASATLGVIVPNLTNPFFPELVEGIQSKAEQYGYAILLAPTHGDRAGIVKSLRQMRSRQVAGIVVVDNSLDDSTLVDALGKTGYVALDRKIKDSHRAWISSDHFAGARKATEHLIDLGHERIAHIAGPQHIQVAHERLQGYRHALDRAGIPYDEALVADADFSEDAGYTATERLLDHGADPTAIFAVSDLTAIGVMRALDSHRLDIPHDISLIGFDDVHLASYIRPGLTTVRQQIHELGRAAAELLVDEELNRESNSRTLPVDVIARGTTAPPKHRTSQTPTSNDATANTPEGALGF